LAGNRTLNQIINGLRQKILLYRLQSLNLPERFEQSIREHRDLMEAFRKRDPEKAENLMRFHLKTRCKALEELAK
jgi:DNA-binding GntR family transcriptional regulator